MTNYINSYLEEAKIIIDKIDQEEVSRMIALIHEIKVSKGRMFILGVGGAGHASHAVNDLEKFVI